MPFKGKVINAHIDGDICVCRAHTKTATVQLSLAACCLLLSIYRHSPSLTRTTHTRAQSTSDSRRKYGVCDFCFRDRKAHAHMK